MDRYGAPIYGALHAGAASFDATATKTSLHFAVGVGKPVVTAVFDSNGNRIRGEQPDFLKSMRVEDGDKRVRGGKRVRVVLHSTQFMSSLPDREELYAIDKSGKGYEQAGQDLKPGSGEVTETVVFHGVTLAQLDRIELRVTPLEGLTVRDISLESGHKTNATIEVEGRKSGSNRREGQP